MICLFNSFFIGCCSCSTPIKKFDAWKNWQRWQKCCIFNKLQILRKTYSTYWSKIIYYSQDVVRFAFQFSNWPLGRERSGQQWSWRASARSLRPWRQRAWPTAWTSQWSPHKEWDLQSTCVVSLNHNQNTWDTSSFFNVTVRLLMSQTTECRFTTYIITRLVTSKQHFS